MTQRKTKRPTGKKTAPKRSAGTKRQPKVPPLVQEALQVTWLLKGSLKNVQIAYIRVGKLLAQVREQNLYTALKHPDIESYAAERLQLRRSSLYKYLQVHDWMAKSHKEWLEPHPTGFIPELNDAGDLMWIEEELARKGLDPAKKGGLEELQTKALSGKLRDGELARWRRQSSPHDAGLKSFLTKLRRLRMRGKELASMPPEVISYLDSAIGVLDRAAPPAYKQ